MLNWTWQPLHTQSPLHCNIWVRQCVPMICLKGTIHVVTRATRPTPPWVGNQGDLPWLDQGYLAPKSTLHNIAPKTCPLQKKKETLSLVHLQGMLHTFWCATCSMVNFNHCEKWHMFVNKYIILLVNRRLLNWCAFFLCICLCFFCGIVVLAFPLSNMKHKVEGGWVTCRKLHWINSSPNTFYIMFHCYKLSTT